MSIIGNPILIGGGGSLKATDALLRVQAPAGSTVTITKGGTTKTDLGHENADDHTLYDYYFIIHQSQFDSNPWTVTATLNGDTASDTIIINAADEYDVELSYRLPNIYQEVEYLETTGTQYLDTGIEPTNDHTLDISIQVSTTSQTQVVFAAPDYVHYSMTCYNSKWSIGQNGSFTDGNGSYSAVVGTDYDIIFNDTNHACIVNETAIKSSMTVGHSGSSTLLIARRTGTGASYGRYRFKSAKLTLISTGESVMELIPCYRKSDSVAGFWDSARKTFLTNSGSGSFVVGGDVN